MLWIQTNPYRLAAGPESSPSTVDFIGAGDEACAGFGHSSRRKDQGCFFLTKKANLSRGCCDLQPHLPHLPAPLTWQQPPHNSGSVGHLCLTESSRISHHVFKTVGPMFHLKICLVVHIGSFLARLFISLTCIAGSRDTGRKPGPNSQVKKVAPEEGRKQRGSSFI